MKTLVNSFVAKFVDALMMYGTALVGILGKVELKEDITGRKITNHVWNNTHQGMMGNLTIDSNGDSKTDFSLLDFNQKRQLFDANLPWCY